VKRQSIMHKQRWCVAFGVVGFGLMMIARAPADERPGGATEIIIVGTVHSPTANFSRKALDEILGKLHPDVLLLELDSSFFEDSFELRKEFRQITLETNAAFALRDSTGAALRPYDIEGRNRFFEEHDYFNREQRLYQMLHKLHEDGRLGAEARATYEALVAFGKVRDAFMAERPEVINSAACDAAIELKQHYAFEGLARIVELKPELAEFKDFVKLSGEFWRRRNDAMVANILEHANEFAGKRIVVLCGLEHRYYLRSKLSERAAQGGIVVREFWEKGD
jgi:hypothetical protein